MTINYTKVYENAPTWELKKIEDALSRLLWFNTEEEAERLYAVKEVLRERRLN
jgi:hypothetical protein